MSTPRKTVRAVTLTLIVIGLLLLPGAILWSEGHASPEPSSAAPSFSPAVVPSAVPSANSQRSSAPSTSQPSTTPATPVYHARTLTASELALPITSPLVVSPGVSPAAGTVSLPYSAAASAMLSKAAGYDGANWAVALGAGLALPSAFTVNVSAATFNSACGFQFIGTPPATITYPATPATASAGTAAFYEFYLSSTTVSSILVIGFVSNGTAFLLAQENSTGGCVFGSVTPIPSNVLDSPTVVGLADQAGGSAFLAANPGAQVDWLVVSSGYGYTQAGNWALLPPEWLVQYASGSCMAFGAAQQVAGHEFTAYFDGMSGAYLGSSSYNCTAASGDYPVTFAETGLPSGTSWSVQFLGTNTSTTSQVGFEVPNGTWYFTIPNVAGYLPSPASGTVAVNGTGITVNITFLPAVTEPVRFIGSGITNDGSWQVTMFNTTNFTFFSGSRNGNGAIEFNVTPGAYAWNLYPPSGYIANQSSGALTITVSGATVYIGFTPPSTYTLTFNETGLPAGTLWGVRVTESVNFTYYDEQNFTTSTSVTFTLPSGNVSFEVGAVPPQFSSTPSVGNAVINGSALDVPVTFATRGIYAVTFTEQGLPTGTAWYVQAAGPYNSSTTTSIGFLLPNVTSTSFSAGGAYGYRAVPAFGLFTVNGSALSILIVFVPTGTTYAVTFTETGLPTNTTWSATLNNIPLASNNSSIIFQIGNGTYQYSIGPVPGFASSPSSGSVQVNGSAFNVTIAFSVGYEVTFSESGLPAGTSWSVTLNGVTNSSTASAINFFEANGSYTFQVGAVTGYAASPASGSVAVSGALVVQAIAFSATGASSWTVTFLESGLPSGTSWSVTLGTSTLSSTGAVIVFTEPNGTFAYSVGALAGYTVTPATGTVTVVGAVVVQDIVFAALPAGQYSVIFTESGLPTGTSWSVTMNGKSASSTGPTIGMAEGNGSYAFAVSPPSGYSASPATGSANVTGHAVSVAITFSATSSPTGGGGTIFGLPAWEAYLLLGLVVILILGALAALLARNRRKNRGPAQPWQSGQSTPPAPSDSAPQVPPPSGGGPPPGAQ